MDKGSGTGGGAVANEASLSIATLRLNDNHTSAEHSSDGIGSASVASNAAPLGRGDFSQAAVAGRIASVCAAPLGGNESCFVRPLRLWFTRGAKQNSSNSSRHNNDSGISSDGASEPGVSGDCICGGPQGSSGHNSAPGLTGSPAAPQPSVLPSSQEREPEGTCTCASNTSGLAAASSPSQELVWDAIEPTDSVAVLLYHRDTHCYLLARQFRAPVLYAEWKRRRRPISSSSHGSHGRVLLPKEGDKQSSLTVPEPVRGEALASASNSPQALEEEDTDSLTSLASGGAGWTYELSGGLCDKQGKSLEQLAAEEVAEEMGFSLRPQDLRRLFSFPESVNLHGGQLTAFAAAVSEADRVSAGGGLASEGECIDVVPLAADEASVRAFLADDTLQKSVDLQHALLWALLYKPFPL